MTDGLTSRLVDIPSSVPKIPDSTCPHHNYLPATVAPPLQLLATAAAARQSIPMPLRPFSSPFSALPYRVLHGSNGCFVRPCYQTQISGFCLNVYLWQKLDLNSFVSRLCGDRVKGTRYCAPSVRMRGRGLSVFIHSPISTGGVIVWCERDVPSH
jgi:hypothetical protein